MREQGHNALTVLTSVFNGIGVTPLNLPTVAVASAGLSYPSDVARDDPEMHELRKSYGKPTMPQITA